jgi:hypothetical protein
MISKVRLRFGSIPGIDPETINTTPITVFVGPNNSGKSRVLSEIQQYCMSGTKNSNALIIDDIEFEGADDKYTDEIISRIQIPEQSRDALSPGNIFVGSKGRRSQVPLDQLREAIQNPIPNIHAYCQWFLQFSTLMLDGPSRMSLVGESGAGDLQQPPSTSLQVLLRDDAKRQEVRRIVADAFGLHFVLDPTNLGVLRVRLSERPPANELEERGIHDEAVRFHAAAQLIDIASDGVKAFTGIIVELIAGDPRVVLIDEPEAFLHPSLVSKLTLKSDKRVFVSTHSSSFIMGCLQAGVPVNIVRLTYTRGVATARILPSQELLELIRNPLLRSTGVLAGLFYEFVVVTESDTDRAFYQEINERLLRFMPEWGIPNCLFVNAQNKQTVQTIVRPLRKLGIPVVGIVDIDVLKEGGVVWTGLLSSLNVPSISHQSLGGIRGAIKKAMDNTGQNMKRDGGIEILSKDDREAASDLLKQLSEYGLFVVPGGELESWLKHLSVGGHGPNWLISIFEKMGEDPTSQKYLRPSVDDVWQFLSKVKAWFVDPNRKGIPSS